MSFDKCLEPFGPQSVFSEHPHFKQSFFEWMNWINWVNWWINELINGWMNYWLDGNGSDRVTDRPKRKSNHVFWETMNPSASSRDVSASKNQKQSFVTKFSTLMMVPRNCKWDSILLHAWCMCFNWWLKWGGNVMHYNWEETATR